VSVYYASIAYTSDGAPLTIPVGGIHPVVFPLGEQRDPFGMHRQAGPYFRMPVAGLATFQVDVHWSAGTYARKHYIDGQEQDYTGESDAVRPDHTFVHHALVKKGEIVAIAVGHGSNAAQSIAAARVQIMINPDLAGRPEPAREPIPPEQTEEPEGPPNVGDGIPQTPFDPEGPDV
jgi:hypothetical protein